MKLIIAYIQPEAMNKVKQQLYARKIYKRSVNTVMGLWSAQGYTENYRALRTR